MTCDHRIASCLDNGIELFRRDGNEVLVRSGFDKDDYEALLQAPDLRTSQLAEAMAVIGTRASQLIELQCVNGYAVQEAVRLFPNLSAVLLADEHATSYESCRKKLVAEVEKTSARPGTRRD